MTTREEIDTELVKHFDPSFLPLWWRSPIIGLGKAKPNDIFEQDPARLLEYVKNYAVK